MNTLFLVLAQYESAEIPLSKLCDDHFGMDLLRATRKASCHQLPVPFYKKSGKGGYFCSAKDWANYLDDQAKNAREEWNKTNKLA